MVQIRWTDGRGRSQEATALLEDIATHGACLQVEKALPLGTAITLKHPSGEMHGIIRYCAYREIGYFVGLQFDLDSEWSPNKFTPQHLLDLEELVMRHARKPRHMRPHNRGPG
jgi:hypothetical protein